MEKKNLWILTEERPKSEVIGTIIEKFAKDYKIACFINILSKNNYMLCAQYLDILHVLTNQ